MWRNGRRNGLKIRWAVTGPCRFESGHRQLKQDRIKLFLDSFNPTNSVNPALEWSALFSFR
jgi:hypothetical protein